MTQNEMTKVKVTIGSLQFEYEGYEDFLKSDVLSLVQKLDKLQARRLIAPVNTLQANIERSLAAHKDLSDVISDMKHDLDSMSEMGEMDTFNLQMAMDRMSKIMSTLASILKQIDDTTNQILTNLK